MATLTPLVGPTCQSPLSLHLLSLHSPRPAAAAAGHLVLPPPATSPLPPRPRPSSPPPLDPRTAELGAAGSTRGTGPSLRPSTAAGELRHRRRPRPP